MMGRCQCCEWDLWVNAPISRRCHTCSKFCPLEGPCSRDLGNLTGGRDAEEALAEYEANLARRAAKEDR